MSTTGKFVYAFVTLIALHLVGFTKLIYDIAVVLLSNPLGYVIIALVLLCLMLVFRSGQAMS